MNPTAQTSRPQKSPIESWLAEAKNWQKKFATKARKEPLTALEGLESGLTLLEQAAEIARNELDIAGLLGVHTEANDIANLLQQSLQLAAERLDQQDTPSGP